MARSGTLGVGDLIHAVDNQHRPGRGFERQLKAQLLVYGIEDRDAVGSGASEQLARSPLEVEVVRSR